MPSVIGAEELLVFIGVLVAICGLIVTVWQAVKAIREMVQPAKDLVGRVEQIEEHLANDKRRLDSQEEAQKLMLRGMLQLIEHETTGNHEDRLLVVKSDIETYLINR